MKAKTSELSGSALDWAVARCEGFIDDCNSWLYQASLPEVADGSFHPSERWEQGGPILDREKISTRWRDLGGPHSYWHAEHGMVYLGCRYIEGKGETPLIASMRCYVFYKLGNEVEVPEA